MTPKDLHDYERECGTESAINMLLLCGPDKYTGDYDKDLAKLEAFEFTASPWAENDWAKGHDW